MGNLPSPPDAGRLEIDGKEVATLEKFEIALDDRPILDLLSRPRSRVFRIPVRKRTPWPRRVLSLFTAIRGRAAVNEKLEKKNTDGTTSDPFGCTNTIPRGTIESIVAQPKTDTV